MLKLWKTFCRKSTNFQDCAELRLSFQQVINTLLHLEPQIGLSAKFFTFPLCQYLFEIFFIFSKKSSFSKTARFFRLFEFVFFTKFCFFVVFLMLFRFCCCILCNTAAQPVRLHKGTINPCLRKLPRTQKPSHSATDH